MTTLDRSPFPNLSRINPEAYTEPFWTAAKEHRFLAQKCAECGSFRMPPAPYCWNCRSKQTEWVEVPGTGTVFSYTIINYSLVPDITKDDLPYVAVVVELDQTDKQKFVGVLVGEGRFDVAIGRPVRVVWDDVKETGVTVPRFELAADGAAGEPAR